MMPSWTFVASAGAVLAAGMRPYFVDVDPSSWTMTPEIVMAHLGRGADVGMVMVVAPFGAPLDTRAWETFADETGIPVVIDAAASFDTLASVPKMDVCKVPTIVSLHATKVFGIGEGSVLLSSDTDLVHRIRRMSNFGFSPHRQSLVPGVNAKVSEYSAAVGLAGLDEWPRARREWEALTLRYQRGLSGIPGVDTSPMYGQGWVSSYCNVTVTGRAADTQKALSRLGIDTRRWWDEGCHGQPAYEAFARGDLSATANLAAQVVGLPFYIDMTQAEVERVCSGLADTRSG